MNTYRRLSRIGVLAIWVVVLASAIASPVSADMGPKPSMEFQIMYDIDAEPAIESVVLLECSDPDCRNTAPLEEMGPQGISCSDDVCRSLAYGYADYMILQLQFDDGVTRESNIFTKNRFVAYYTVTVRDSSLAVRQTGGINNPAGALLGLFVGVTLTMISGILFILIWVRGRDTEVNFKAMPVTFIAIWVLAVIGAVNGLLVIPSMPLTFLLESIIILGYATNQKEARTPWFTLVLLANLLTQPVLIASQLASGGGGQSYMLWMIGAEVLIVLAEAGIYKACKRKDLGLVQALIISLIMNLASFLVGLLLPL